MRRSLLVLLLLAAPAQAAQNLSGPATVIDGDTIELNGVRIHLYGIDAPESAQLCETAGGRSYPCGREATRRLRHRIGEATVTCEPHQPDGKGRISAVCRVGAEDLSAWLVTQGFALASRTSSTSYVRQESRAWATRKGIWAGTFERPADWRDDHRRIEAAAGAGPESATR
jgi:endonuclease YncB( thermonuclease family)